MKNLPTPFLSSHLLQPGFTLVELTIVIVLVGLISLLALPSFSTLRNARNGAATQQLYRDLIFAQERAITIGATHWVVISLDSQNWTILQENPSQSGKSTASPVTDPYTGKPFIQSMNTENFSGVKLASVDFDGTTSIGFDAAGRPLNGSETSLTKDGKIHFVSGSYVKVIPITGLVSYQSP